MKDRIARIEVAVAGLLSVIAVVFHFLAATSAGALWRDEANTVGLATLPSIHDVWRNLQYDSFPAGWILFVRFIAGTAGAMNDTAFRTVGLVIGLSLLILLWINARVFRYELPLISLALMGLNPSVIRWGDSLRAYGAGMSLAILVGIMIWRMVEKPSPGRMIQAALSAIAAVQILYYNAPVVLAFCTAGIVVAITKREYRVALGIFAVGAIAALSLMIYVPVIRGAGTWNSLVTVPNYDLSWFTLKLDEAIAPLGGGGTSAWMFAALITVWLCVRQFVIRPVALSEAQRRKVNFAIAALITISFAHFLFLKTLSYLTQPWYYLTLLAIVAVSIDIISGTLVVTAHMRVARLVVAVAIAAGTLLPANRYVKMRMTNVDAAARSIASKARSDDMILLVPWYNGVSFSRYYSGPTPVTTVPEMSFHAFHRYDLISAEMQRKDQMEVVRKTIEQIHSTLRSGRTLFLVSDGRVWTQAAPATLLPAARIPVDGWKSPLYHKQWAALVGADLRRHAMSISTQDLNGETPVSKYENLYLTVVRGWRE